MKTLSCPNLWALNGLRKTLLGWLGENDSHLVAPFFFLDMPRHAPQRTRKDGQRQHDTRGHSCHQVVQVLKAQYGMPMGDVMYYPARHEFHAQAAFGCCNMMAASWRPRAFDCKRMREGLLWMAVQNCMHEQSCSMDATKVCGKRSLNSEC